MAERTLHDRMLAGEAVPINDGQPIPGWYWHRSRGLREIVFVQPHPEDETVMIAFAGREREGGEWLDQDETIAAWPALARNPIPVSTWIAVNSTGVWPDVIPQPQESPVDATVPAAWSVPAGIGDNRGPALDDEEGFKLSLDAAIEPLAKRLGVIRAQMDALPQGAWKQIDADRAANLNDTATRLQDEAEAAFKAAKKPYDDRLGIIRTVFRPMIDGIPALKSTLREGMRAFDKAEKARLQAEAAAKVAAGANIADAAPKKPTMGGASGRKTTIRTTWVGVITDRAAFLDAMKDREEISDTLQSLANALAKANITAPGMERKEKAV